MAKAEATRSTITERLRRFAASQGVKEAAAISFVIALASVMLFRAFGGDWPVGHDHPVHLFRIWQLKQHLISHATPWSWSQRWFAGCPISLVYPVGADFFVLAVQVLSFGTLSISQAYALAFWLFYFLYGYAAYYFISRAVVSRLAACVAVLFFLTDPGYDDIGGWFWLVDAGVWTAALGMVPALIGTVRVADLFERPRPRTAAAVGLCIGFGSLCHQLILVYFAIAIVLLTVIRYLTTDETPWRRSFLWIGVAVVCGLLIASFWLVPHLAVLPYISEIGIGGQWSGSTFGEVGAKLARGQLFTGMFWLATAVGLVALVVFLRARQTMPLFMAMFSFLAIFLSSASIPRMLNADTAGWLEKNMIFPRLLMLVKPFWYGAGAFLLVSSVRLMRHAIGPKTSPPSTNARRKNLIAHAVIALFVCVCVVPLLYHSVETFVREEVLRPTRWNSGRTDLADRAAFIQWANTTLPKAPEFFRIAHGFDQDEHNLTDLGIYIPYPFYKIYNTPTGDHFKYNLGSASNEALRAANVRFAISEHAIERPDFSLERRFGQSLLLYRVTNWNPQPFEISGGAGTVKLEQLDDEVVTLRAEAGAHGLLRLNVTYFPKWHVTREGIPVPITPLTVSGVANSLFMQVPLQPGLYRFEYDRTLSDYSGTILFSVGLATCLILTLPHRLRHALWQRAASIPSNSARLFAARKRNQS
ncbi:MAG: hypothetical protein DME45_03370 [Verrucomicrobia bacterium]|nr:MAG: hypothetical protein DME45_03370 [Verrucomicrobiota bacterium]